MASLFIKFEENKKSLDFSSFLQENTQFVNGMLQKILAFENNHPGMEVVSESTIADRIDYLYEKQLATNERFEEFHAQFGMSINHAAVIFVPLTLKYIAIVTGADIDEVLAELPEFFKKQTDIVKLFAAMKENHKEKFEDFLNQKDVHELIDALKQKLNTNKDPITDDNLADRIDYLYENQLATYDDFEVIETKFNLDLNCSAIISIPVILKYVAKVTGVDIDTLLAELPVYFKTVNQ